MDDLADPIVAVVVPAKNDAEFLRACLRSVREQWFQPLECVVIDDGSSDETARIASEFAEKDERFSVVSHPVSQGPSAARNTGIARTSAPFVTFLDADDFLYQHSIKRRVEALLDADPDLVAGTFCDWQATSQNQGRKAPERTAASRRDVVGFVDGPECPFIVTAPVVRRSVLEQVGGFDETLLTAEDFDLWIRVLREGHTFTYVPIIGVAYRQNASGLVFSESADHAESAMSIIERQYEDVSEEEQAPTLGRPLPYYQLESARAKRLLRTYALAAAANETDDAERLGQLIGKDLRVLEHAGLDTEGELRAGAWRASRAIPELRDGDARRRFVQGLLAALNDRVS